MKSFPFYIARRYLFAKKSTNAINVISAISCIGVAVATMALVVTLSVFNGFHDMVATFFTSFDPQLKIVPAMGKTVPADDPPLTEVRKLKELSTIFQSQTRMMHGVMVSVTRVRISPDLSICGTIGIRLAETLGTGARWNGYLKVYAPRREGQLDMGNPTEGFVEDSLISPGVVFAVKQSKYDKGYIITPLEFARNLFGTYGMISSLELRVKPGSNLDAVKRKVKKLKS